MPAPPDVAIMLFDLSVSGVARNAVRVANAAHATGFRIEVWLGQPQGELRAALDRGIVQRSLGAELAAGYTRRDRKLASDRLASSLAFLYDERRPAVALSAGNHFHDLAATARGLAANRNMRLIGRVSNAAPNANRSLNPLKTLLKRRKAAARYAKMDRLIAVSQEISDELVARLKIPKGKISVIPNGIDLGFVQQQALHQAEWPWHDDVPTILGVGRLTPQKNFELLIDAFALARRSRPLRLSILGSGPAGAREALIDRAVSLGVADDLWLPGQVANPFPYYRTADLFVLSSRWEGMSNALLEALACGCPVVAAKSAVGSAEILDHGRFGRLTETEPQALANAVLASLDDSISADMLIARAREFDLEQALKRYVTLFEEEIASTPHSGSTVV